jgi:hypothetical protein
MLLAQQPTVPMFQRFPSVTFPSGIVTVRLPLQPLLWQLMVICWTWDTQTPVGFCAVALLVDRHAAAKIAAAEPLNIECNFFIRVVTIPLLALPVK